MDSGNATVATLKVGPTLIRFCPVMIKKYSAFKNKLIYSRQIYLAVKLEPFSVIEGAAWHSFIEVL